MKHLAVIWTALILFITGTAFISFSAMQRKDMVPEGPSDSALHSVYEIQNFKAIRNPLRPRNWRISFDVIMPVGGWAEVEYFTDDGYWKRAGIFYNTSRDVAAISIVLSDQINKPRFNGWRVRAKCKDGTTVRWR